ncbi:helix-turn-helix transcriptional regulator [Acidisoma sp. S159]|uniref:ArsR/SmtB family transcription factor n=1 Tax=Acidisoma sp. S159 TaxID=1747225 RepID=UPI00131C8643|nr:metalloregulator ArsR/SmtB family transcription factor [Acidisoma sp. S159]
MTRDPVDINSAVAVLRVIANPARLRIVLQLLNGEQAVSEIERTLEIRQPTLSQHLGELRDSGLVATRRESRVIFYKLAGSDQERLIHALTEGFGGVVPAVRPIPKRHHRFAAFHAATFAVVEE